MKTISITEIIREFHAGKCTVFYQLEGGVPAVLANCGRIHGFLYLGKLDRTPKFAGITATDAVTNALKAGRNVIFTTNRPTLQLP